MRFYGAVGYASEAEGVPGVWTETMTEVSYRGDVIRNSRRLDPPSMVPPTVVNDVSLENSFSIVGDEQAFANFTAMRYVMWEGQRWTITHVEIRRPRLILTVGGMWDGNTA
jgi:hypothetical protein